MIVTVGQKRYELVYFPFFRKEAHEDFSIYGMRMPSGKIEEVLVFDVDDDIQELKTYCEFLIREYVLEEDIALTQQALEFKNDLMDLFYEKK